MRRHHFADPITGIISSDYVDVPEGDLPLALQRRPGQILVPGVTWPETQRIAALVADDFGNQVAVLEDFVPPAPADDELRTWHWDAEQRGHVPTPTLLALQRKASAPLLAQLAELDARLARPLGELAEASATGQAAPAEAVERLQQINASKAQLRQQLAAIAASTSAAELASIVSTINP